MLEASDCRESYIWHGQRLIFHKSKQSLLKHHCGTVVLSPTCSLPVDVSHIKFHTIHTVALSNRSLWWWRDILDWIEERTPYHSIVFKFFMCCRSATPGLVREMILLGCAVFSSLLRLQALWKIAKAFREDGISDCQLVFLFP